MDIITFLLVTLMLLLAVWWFFRHDPKLPPCPVTPLPLVGHLLYMDKNPRKQFKQWRKKCGDIYSLYLGQSLVVVLNGYDLIKEALIKQGDKCSDRPYLFFDAATGKVGLGVAYSSGENWKEHRTVTVNILRALGMGKNVVLEKITEIATIHNELLASYKGKPFDIDNILIPCIANIICSVIIGHRFNHDDKDFLKNIALFRETVFLADGNNLANYFNFWPYIPGDLFKAKKIKALTEEFISNFVEPFIQKKGYDEYDENNLDNYIARYIFEMNKKNKSGEKTTMSDENLKKIVHDLFGAGVETSSTTLRWCVLYLIHHQDKQEKIYQEIEQNVGTERLPKLADKPQLPYLSAFIQETQRIASIVPLNVHHLCTDDIIVGGYTLPKGTSILPTLDSILFDKKTWGEDVNEFKPERFINENGKVMHPEELVPFSLGKRVCAGESIAKAELFLFFAFMVQRFKILPEDSKSLPSLEALIGLTANPHPFKVRMIERR